MSVAPVSTVQPRQIRAYAPLYPPRTSRGSWEHPQVVMPPAAAGSPTAHDDDPEPWSKVLASAILNAVDGRREIRSLHRWIAKELFAQLSDSRSTPSPTPRDPKPVKPHSARLWYTTPDIVEVSVTLWDRDRLRAVALRLERSRGKWVVTALEFG